MTLDATDRPSTPSPAYRDAAPDVQMIRDLLAGTRQMHANYKTYIPKWSAEKPESYKKRATAAKVYGGLARALSASVGMLFAREPHLSDGWTDAMLEQWENVDAKGTHGAVFAKRHAESALADGFAAILVDFPPVPDGVTVTAASEEALNLRPKWAAYARSDVLSWRTAVVDNAETLTQVVLRESLSVPKGRFGTVTVPVYRVCTLTVTPDSTPENGVTRIASWELLEERADLGGGVTLVSHGSGVFRDRDGVPFNVIPLAVGYAGRTDETLCAHPPLLDLAWCNLEHWRIASDLRYYEQLCAFPQPVLTGELAKVEGQTVAPTLRIGPTVVIHLADATSKFEWRELDGKSITALRASLQEKKDEMGELGASFLAKKTRGVESAEAKRIDASAENATLATAAQAVEDCLNQALIFHAKYLGIPEEQAPSLTVNKDFEGLTLDAPTMTAYATLHRETGLPLRLILEALQAGGRIDPDEDLDALEQEMMANAAAQADQAKLDAAAQADALANGTQQAAA